MQAVLQSLERQHEEEKRSALERQRQMYELELQQLRRKLSPECHAGAAPQAHHRSMERLSVGPASSAQIRLRQWTEDRCVLRVEVCVSGGGRSSPHSLLFLFAPSGRWCWSGVCGG